MNVVQVPPLFTLYSKVAPACALEIEITGSLVMRSDALVPVSACNVAPNGVGATVSTTIVTGVLAVDVLPAKSVNVAVTG